MFGPERERVADPSIADGARYHLDPRHVSLERTIRWIVATATCVPLLTGLVALTALAPVPWWLPLLLGAAWVAVTTLLIVLALFWPDAVHRHASYRVDLGTIEIRKGVFWRRVIRVPVSRVQHTDVSQGPLERRYGLGTLVIYTAGTEHAKVDVPGLDHGTALRIRDHLLPREGEDAV